MRVLVYEDNLLWSSRMAQSLKALGHEPLIRSRAVPEQAPVAIVNLSSQALRPAELVPSLVEMGAHVIGHAGHKEKALRELGLAAGCQTVASNSELTFKLEALLDQATS